MALLSLRIRIFRSTARRGNGTMKAMMAMSLNTILSRALGSPSCVHILLILPNALFGLFDLPCPFLNGGRQLDEELLKAQQAAYSIPGVDEEVRSCLSSAMKKDRLSHML